MTPLRTRAEEWLRGLQQRICDGLERADGAARFRTATWERPGGGGGDTRIITHGAVFETGGVNFSAVHGAVSAELAAALATDARTFDAVGLSLVLHPASPLVPTVHANYRHFELSTGDAWFGGGSDLTPYVLIEDDARHFHRTLKTACDAHDPTCYARFKAACDAYFFLPLRNEHRGVGGIFFDYERGTAEERERFFALWRNLGDVFLPSYLPIVERRRDLPFTERQRQFQLLRRGRYVEFNLVYDRGTRFGLQTQGRTESILMSLPPLARWEYDWRPEPGSEEERLLDVLRRPRAWA